MERTRTPTTATTPTSDPLREAVAAMSEAQRLRRLEELKQVVARQGGILLDPNETRELIALGESLGIVVVVERVDLPRLTPRTPPQPDVRRAPKAGGKAAKPQHQAPIFPTE